MGHVLRLNRGEPEYDDSISQEIGDLNFEAAMAYFDQARRQINQKLLAANQSHPSFQYQLIPTDDQNVFLSGVSNTSSGHSTKFLRPLATYGDPYAIHLTPPRQQLKGVKKIKKPDAKPICQHETHPSLRLSGPYLQDLEGERKCRLSKQQAAFLRARITADGKEEIRLTLIQDKYEFNFKSFRDQRNTLKNPADNVMYIKYLEKIEAALKSGELPFLPAMGTVHHTLTAVRTIARQLKEVSQDLNWLAQEERLKNAIKNSKNGSVEYLRLMKRFYTDKTFDERLTPMEDDKI
jgi:hypothetical protein